MNPQDDPNQRPAQPLNPAAAQLSGPQQPYSIQDYSQINTFRPTPPNKAKKLVVLISVIVLIVIVGVVISLVASASRNRAAKKVAAEKLAALRGIDQATGIKYTKIKSTNKVADLSKTYDTDKVGFHIYETTKSSKTVAETLPSTCKISSSSMSQFDSGIAIFKNVLKNSGIEGVTIQNIVNLYKTSGQSAQLVTVGTKQVAYINDGGKGIHSTCINADKSYQKNLDISKTFVYLTDKGDDLMISMTIPDNLVNNLSLDTESSTKAAKVFTTVDLETEIKYIVNNN